MEERLDPEGSGNVGLGGVVAVALCLAAIALAMLLGLSALSHFIEGVYGAPEHILHGQVAP